MPRRPRGIPAVVAAAVAILVLGVQAVSASVLWTMSASPATAVVGEPTTFTFTATNLDPLLGIKCVVVEIPEPIVPGDAWIAGSSTTAAWMASRSGQLLTAVIGTGDGNEKLVVGDWVSFAVAGVPTTGGTYAFQAIAYSGHECMNGARVLSAPPVVVISGPIVPEPTPAPTPEATPTPAPQLLPPLPPLPPILRSPQPLVLTTPGPAATPAPSPSPSAATSPSPSPADVPPARPQNQPPPQVRSLDAAAGPGATLVVPVDGGGAAPLALAPAVDGAEAASELSLGRLSVLDSLSAWAIPGAVVGGPGVLVILWVAMQASVAAAWIPAVRLLRGADGRQARPPYAAH